MFIQKNIITTLTTRQARRYSPTATKRPFQVPIRFTENDALGGSVEVPMEPSVALVAYPIDKLAKGIVARKIGALGA